MSFEYSARVMSQFRSRSSSQLRSLPPWSSAVPEIVWMHWTARAPWYPSDSTRSLAGVGLQDGLRAAARGTTTRDATGRARRPAYTTGLADRAGRSRAGSPVHHLPRQPRRRLRRHPRRRHQRPGMVPQVRIRPTPPRSSSVTTHGPRAAEDGAAVRARTAERGRYPYRNFPGENQKLSRVENPTGS